MRTNHRGASKEPTFILLVEKALQEANDFMLLSELMERTQLSTNRVTASLASLRSRKAADFMVEEHEYDDIHWIVTYWYATPETDTRIRKVEERVREEPGTRKRSARLSTPKEKS